jgi:hypothetical protein
MISRADENPRTRIAAEFYLAAKSNVIANGFAGEVDWQSNVDLANVREAVFLREAAWVILSSGLSERAVRARFPDITLAFDSWQSAAAIWRNRREHRLKALNIFSSARKIDAILVICGFVARYGFERCMSLLAEDGLDFLTRFRYLGPATGRHLAKNLGFAVAKPDRHLTRIASLLGYLTVSDLCAEIAAVVGDSVPVVDIVLWRYATLNRGYAADLRSLYLDASLGTISAAD